MKKALLILTTFLFFITSNAQLFEDFEGETFPPENWIITNVNNPSSVWTQSWSRTGLEDYIYNGDWSAIVNARQNIGEGNSTQKWLITDQVTIDQNFLLSFFIKKRLPQFENTEFQVRISTDSNQNNLNSFTILSEFGEDDTFITTFFKRKFISLENYVGQTVYLAFVATMTQPGNSLTGNRFFLDDISFESGINMQLISFLDSNNNGVKDAGEPKFLKGNLNYQINNMGETVSATSYDNVFYIFPENETDTYDFNYSIYDEYVDFYSEPISFDDIAFSQTESNVYYIPIVNTAPYNDVAVSLVASNQPGAGFFYFNKIFYTNSGAEPVSGTISFEKDSALTITDILGGGTVNSPTGFTLDYSDLMPSETRSISIKMSVPPIPIVALGDLVTNSVSISSLTTDANPNNNTASQTRPIVASYDPNDKNEAHGDKIALADFSEDDYLYYTIRFQNTGTANATFVRVEDVLDAQLNPESLRMISASHPFVLERINNQLVWKFDNIQLVPQNVDEDASIGFVHFKIKPNQGFAVGDIIPNTADIYFDFNPVIVTNTFETEFVENLSTPDFTNSTVLFSPNPTKDKLQIQLNGSDAIQQISIYDVVGKRIYFKDKLEINTTSVDFSSFNQGVYLVELITTSNQKMVNKIIKQ